MAPRSVATLYNVFALKSIRGFGALWLLVWSNHTVRSRSCQDGCAATLATRAGRFMVHCSLGAQLHDNLFSSSVALAYIALCSSLCVVQNTVHTDCAAHLLYIKGCMYASFRLRLHHYCMQHAAAYKHEPLTDSYPWCTKFSIVGVVCVCNHSFLFCAIHICVMSLTLASCTPASHRLMVIAGG